MASHKLTPIKEEITTADEAIIMEAKYASYIEMIP